MKKSISASEIEVGDTICFSNPVLNVRVEQIGIAQWDGAVGVHGNNGTWSCYYKPSDRVRIHARHARQDAEKIDSIGCHSGQS